MANDLSKYGIVPRKTFLINKLPNIPNNLYRHFVRGYFDGDGCITFTKPKDQKIRSAKIVFCGTEAFLDDLNIKINQETGLEIRKLIDMNKYGSNVFNLRYLRVNDVYTLYDYMYNDSTIFLTRKKIRFEKFIEERK